MAGIGCVEAVQRSTNAGGSSESETVEGWVAEGLSHREPSKSASEGRGNNLNDFKVVFFNAKTGIWP